MWWVGFIMAEYHDVPSDTHCMPYFMHEMHLEFRHVLTEWTHIQAFSRMRACSGACVHEHSMRVQSEGFVSKTRFPDVLEAGTRPNQKPWEVN